MYVDNDFIWWISPRSLAMYFQLNFFLKSHQKPPCDVCNFINSLQHKGYEILLSLDANETMGQDQKYGNAHLMVECSLSNLHLMRPDPPPATY